MSGSQWQICGWAFVVASFALNGNMNAAATIAAIIGCTAFVSGVFKTWWDRD